MAPTATQSLSQFTGKKVTVVYTVEGKSEAIEAEGKVDTGNDLGLLFKPKGKTQLILIPAASIEDVRLEEEKAKALTRKTLKVVQLGQARNHLLERHAYTLTKVNELTEQQAFDEHAGLDHEASDLGHVHKDKDSNDKE